MVATRRSSTISIIGAPEILGMDGMFNILRDFQMVNKSIMRLTEKASVDFTL
jgi:hypothetical protein